MPLRYLALATFAVVLLFVCAASPALSAESESSILLTVNGTPITEQDLTFAMRARRIPPNRQADMRDAILEELVDRQLIAEFLKKRAVTVNQVELESVIARFRLRIEREGGDLDALLKSVGYTEETLKEALALPLMWQAHVRTTATEEVQREYFNTHRRRFDGTALRVSQIVLTTGSAPSDDDVAAKVSELKQLRDRIEAKEIQFADAAREHSDSPSGKKGGDLGFFTAESRMPEAWIEQAFALKIGETSQPFTTRYGVHLIQVTAEKTGEISLEDARGAVLNAISHERWNDVVAAERATATIEHAPPDGP